MVDRLNFEGFSRPSWDQPGVVKSAETALDHLRLLLGGAFPNRSLVEQFRPDDRWFLRDPKGIHGIGHITRVFILQELVSGLQMLQGQELDRLALRWGASCHDLRRVNDGMDYQHGERASQWMLGNLQDQIPAASLAKASYIVTWHVPSDGSAPEMTPELAVFKDADNLDRVRLGDLDPRYLRHPYSKMLLPAVADELSARSDLRSYAFEEDPFRAVLNAAIELGIVLD